MNAYLKVDQFEDLFLCQNDLNFRNVRIEHINEVLYLIVLALLVLAAQVNRGNKEQKFVGIALLLQMTNLIEKSHRHKQSFLG
jgi:hypothetical protein